MADLFVKAPREGGYTFVTCPDLPGWSAMLQPGESVGHEHIIRSLILLAGLNGQAAERERCKRILQRAREGEIDQDLRSLIGRVERGDDEP